MPTVKKNQIVYLDIITKCEGDVVDKFSEDNSFSYIHGHGNIIRILEEYLDGEEIGFSGEIEVGAEDAFGEYYEDLIIEVQKDALSKDVKIEIGTQVETEGPDGMVHLYIKSINEDNIILDANHPLAGKDIIFNMKILDIKEAHEDEIRHGRPHPIAHNMMVEDSSWVECGEATI